MKRTLAVLCAALAVGAAIPARAAEEKDKEKEKAAQTIQMASVALPVIVDGALLNYVFVSIKLELQPGADGAGVRGKEQFFRDDLVRYGHRTPFTRMDDYTRVDEAKVRAEILRAAVGIVGPGVVKTALITKQTSQKMLTTPSAGRKRAPDIIP